MWVITCHFQLNHCIIIDRAMLEPAAILPIVRGLDIEDCQDHNPLKHGSSHMLCPSQILLHGFLRLVSSILVQVYHLGWQGLGPLICIFITL